MKLFFCWLTTILGTTLLAGTIETVRVEREGVVPLVLDQVSAHIHVKAGEKCVVKFKVFKEGLLRGQWDEVPDVIPPQQIEAPLIDKVFSVTTKSAPSPIWGVYFYHVEVISDLGPQNPSTLSTPALTLLTDDNRKAAEARVGYTIFDPPAAEEVVDIASIRLPEAASLSDRPLDIESIRRLTEELERQGPPPFDPKRVLAVPETETYVEPVYFFTNRPWHTRFDERKEPWYAQFKFEAARNDGYSAQKIVHGATEVIVPKKERNEGDPIRGFKLSSKVTWKRPGELVDELWNQDVLVYIHGFNTSFEDALLRASQLRRDLKWKGAVLAVDWPSRGLLAAYHLDRSVAEDDAFNAQQVGHLLSALGRENAEFRRFASTRGKRHVLAHSMGNEVLWSSVKWMRDQNLLTPGLFDENIFAAPDLYVEHFAEMSQLLFENGATKRMTLYYSRKDIAVNSSRFINLLTLDTVTSPRNALHFLQGRAGITPKDYPHVDEINTDGVNSAWTTIAPDFRHGYYASSDLVIDDLKYVVHYGLSIENRVATVKGFKEISKGVSQYYIAP